MRFSTRLKSATGLLVGAALFCFLAPPARATLLWEALTNNGTHVFEGLEEAPGTIVLTNDPLGTFGTVYNYNTWDDTNYSKERCESRGTVYNGTTFRMSYNTEYYIGWREMWQPMPIDGSWVAVFQMHGYGVSGQGAPLVFRAVNGDGNLYLQNGANGVDTNFWHQPFVTGVWHTFVLHVLLNTNPAVGYTELWYDGNMQTFNNGQTRWYGPTWDNVDGIVTDSYNLVKWGVYRSGTLNGKGPASTFMSDAKIGTTFADVNPSGSGNFSISTTPSSQTLGPSGSTNYTVNVTYLGGFTNTVSFAASGLPFDASASFNPPSLTSSGSTIMTVTTMPDTPTGSSVVTITGTSSIQTNTTTVGLIVANFTLSATPPSQTVNASNSVNYTVSAVTNGFFTGTANLGISGLPAGATAVFSPPALDGGETSTLTVQTTTSTPGGGSVLTIYATNGGVVLTTTVNLNVTGLSANPGVMRWTSASGTDTNWSTPLNWTNITAGGFGPPSLSNSVVFTNIGAVAASAITAPGSGVVVPANINSFVNASISVGNMTNINNAINTSPNYHNIGIAIGTTLTVNGNLEVGGCTAFDFGPSNTANVTISGTGATLQVSNSAVLVTGGTASGNSGNHQAMLDLSGLDTFLMNGTQIKLGVENNKKASGVVYLAKTNIITVGTAGYTDPQGTGSPQSGNPALYVGHNTSAFGSGAQLYLGITNAIFVDYVTVGRGDTNDLLAFNPAFLGMSPSVRIRGTNGDSTRVGLYVVGDGSSGAVATAPATNDFSGGAVDAMINYLCVGRGRTTNSSVGATGVLTFDTGTINANKVAIGFTYTFGSNSPAIGTVNVNGTATLTTMSNIVIAQAANTAGHPVAPQGTLNINGGTVQSTNIIGLGGISTINLNSGTLDLQFTNPAPGQIANVSTLNIGSAGLTSPALLVNAASIVASNSITIASNGILQGNTIVTTPGLTVNGAISPGASQMTGSISNNGAATFGGGGNYTVTVLDAMAGPVAGWSFLNISSGLAVQASSGSPFIIRLGTGSGSAANFTYHTNYDWPIVASGAGVTNFSSAAFPVDISLFQNDLAGGYFFVRTNPASPGLILSFTNNHPPTAGPATVYLTSQTLAIPLASLATNWSDPDGDPVALVSVNSSSANGVNNVGTDGTFIYYTNGVPLPDTITYTVQDIRNNSPAVYLQGDTVQTATGVIHVLPAPVLTAAPMAVSRTAGLSLMISLADVATNWSDSASLPISLTGINLVTTNGVNLTTNSSYIFYTNSPNVNDQISYSIADTAGVMTNGVINIVISGAVFGQVSQQITVTGNSATAYFAGVPGYLYNIQRSTNLVAGEGWVTICITNAPPGGLFNFTDTFGDLGTVPASAYYRLAWSP